MFCVKAEYSPPTKIIFIFIYSIYKLCQDNLKKQQNPERESEEKLEEEGDYSVNKSDVNPLVNQIVRKVGSAIGGIGGGFLVNPHWAHMLVIILRIRAISYSKE